MNHTCEPGADPRRRGICVRCGRPILPAVGAVKADETLVELDLRNPDFEREATRVAASQAGVNAEGLLAFSEARTLPGPVRQHQTRDFRQEAAEEAADGRNYCVWWLEQMDAAGVDDPIAKWNVMRALGAFALAYHHIAAAIYQD